MSVQSAIEFRNKINVNPPFPPIAARSLQTPRLRDSRQRSAAG